MKIKDFNIVDELKKSFNTTIKVKNDQYIFINIQNNISFNLKSQQNYKFQ